MSKKFIVDFRSEINNGHIVFGPFVERKFAESFIEAEVRLSKQIADNNQVGYGKLTQCKDTTILPSYGSWEIVEMNMPLNNGLEDHVQNW